MIYLIGGSPRAGKSTLCQLIAAQLGLGWISTDLLVDQLRLKNIEGIKTEWDASSGAVAAAAEWFFPSLERFVWGVSSLADSYVIEGVDFLPEHVVRLAIRFTLRSMFLGCSKMTLDRFDRFPGRSKGYSGLSEEVRLKLAQDIPLWSELVRLEAQRFGLPYIDTSEDFPSRLAEAGALLTADSFRQH